MSESRFSYDAVCGLYCGACDVLLANRAGTVEALAEAWERELAQLRCHGCRSKVNAVYCVDCDIKLCARGKGVEHCFQCAGYACAGDSRRTLVAFRNDGCAHHSIVLVNQEAMREGGVDRWLAAQRARWSCPGCGRAFSWYDKACQACGRELYNCEAEEADLAFG